MPDKPYNTNRAIAALLISLIFYLLLLWISWELTKLYFSNHGMQTFTFNFWRLLLPGVLIVDIFIYRWLKGKYIIRRYANLHIITVIIRMMILPLLYTAVGFMMITHSASQLLIVARNAAVLLWTGNIIFITGHIFLILVILQRNNWPVPENTEGDHLNEFDR